MEKIIVGKINKPHGVRGELSVTPETDFVEERFIPGKKFYINYQGQEEEYILKSIRPHQKRYLLKFEDIENVNEVDHLRNANLLIDYDELHELENDEYYFIDLIGLDVYVEDNMIGVVGDVVEMPAHPVLVIETDERDIMVPCVDQFIKDVNLDKKTISIDWLEGL